MQQVESRGRYYLSYWHWRVCEHNVWESLPQLKLTEPSPSPQHSKVNSRFAKLTSTPLTFHSPTVMALLLAMRRTVDIMQWRKAHSVHTQGREHTAEKKKLAMHENGWDVIQYSSNRVASPKADPRLSPYDSVGCHPLPRSHTCACSGWNSPGLSTLGIWYSIWETRLLGKPVDKWSYSDL